MDHMDWDDLRVALRVAREGSIRRAARSLGVSHSTVLRRVGALEATTGVRLFERKGEGYQLTAAGQDVFETSKEVEALMLALERRVEGRDMQLSGDVRVTLPDPLWPCLAPELAAFARAYPGISVSVAAGTSFADMAHREADVALRIATNPPDDLVGRRIADVACGVYGARRYVRGRERAELGSLDWITWAPGSNMVFGRWLAAEVPDARVVLRVTSGWAFRAAIDAGAGVAIMPCALGDLQPTWTRLRLLPELTTPLWILTHRDLRTMARVRALRDFMAAAIQRRGALLEGRSPARATRSRPRAEPA